MKPHPSLNGLLESIFKTYHRARYLSSDPLEFPHRYTDPWDREAVALVSALLAYGNVKQIRASIEQALKRIESGDGTTFSTPKSFVKKLGNSDGMKAGLKGFRGYVHRFNSGEDLVILFALLNRSWENFGSLGAHFVSHLSPGDPDISLALNGLISDWREWIQGDSSLSALAHQSPSHSYLMTAPQDGSCCKRWCMLLRWMGRQDPESEPLDLGLWAQGSKLSETFPHARALSASQLVIPLDTHTGRISQYLGLTKRKTLNWRAALEVTQALKSCDALDPTKYDFALARLGILDLCQRKYRVEICSRCDLMSACQFAQKGQQRLSAYRKFAIHCRV